jgi:hypothetical protein
VERYDSMISIGPVSGLRGVARELILHLGVDPDEHPGLLVDVQQAIEEETLEIGRAMLTERGIPMGEPLL